MKILYITTISRTMNFFKSFVSELVKNGHTVEFACNCEEPIDSFYDGIVSKTHNLPFSRSPLDKSNRIAYKSLKNLVESGEYDIVHCHTPIAAMLTRFACRKVRKKGTKVIYTAHGFHFYKGSPKLNWLLFYTTEKICSYFTDVLITINKEDYALASKKLKTKTVEYVPGVGISIDKFTEPSVDIQNLRSSFGFKNDDFVLISVGELSARKNHEVIIKSLGNLNNPKLKLLIVGDGNLEQMLKALTKELKIENQVVFAGYRKDICDLLHMSDAFVFPSLQEGLPVVLMEAMAAGIPIICSRIRGNVDLIDDEKGGYLVNPKDVDSIAEAIKALLKNYDTLQEMVKTNLDTIKNFEIKRINEKMFNVYKIDNNMENS